ncbi:hypothetical protein HDV57DRAFT_4472 [Trichoderma longibrachiatum]|uniref:Secreted protein n=1 Tax=Trichoderma longibrachiatum ATCC 18648 TaxID=983965 RepID=A0A2T4CJT0_TRILO|nr:hypothetical protein M440DRAFT_1024764 [Trichoderma longibrachiatum ATCC 18648]
MWFVSSVTALVTLARLSPTPGFRGRWAANSCVYHLTTLLLGGHDACLESRAASVDAGTISYRWKLLLRAKPVVPQVPECPLAL